MWIENIFMERFGAFRNVGIRDLSFSVNVIAGANEAGKTTVAEFVRSVLFGFRKKRGRKNIYEPPHGSLRKGRLEVRSEEYGYLRLERTEAKGNRQGVLTITNEAGYGCDEPVLRLFRNGFDRHLYESLYALDLDRLRDVDRETLRGRIVGTALGALHANPSEILREIESRVKRLEKRSANQPHSLGSLHDRLVDIDRKIGELDRMPARYEELKKELARVQKEREALGEMMGDCESRLETLGTLNRYREQWKRLTSIETRLEKLEEARRFPTDGLTRFEQSVKSERDATRKVSVLEETLANLHEQLEHMNTHAVLREHANAIEKLWRRGQVLGALEDELPKQNDQVRGYRDALDKEIADLGCGWTVDRIATFDTSLEVEKAIRSFVETWRSIADEVQDVAGRIWVVEEEGKTISRKMRDAADLVEQLEPACRECLSPLQHGLIDEWRECCDQEGRLTDRAVDGRAVLRQLHADQKDLETLLTRLKERDAPLIHPLHLWVGLSIFGLAGTGSLISFAMGSGPLAVVHLCIGSGLMLGIPLLVRWKNSLERAQRVEVSRERASLIDRGRRIGAEIAARYQEAKKLVRRIQDLRSRKQKIAGDILGNPSADHEDFALAKQRSLIAEEAARKRRNASDTRESLSVELRETRNAARDLDQTFEQAKERLEHVKQGWSRFLAETDLDRDLEPEAALVLLRQVREVKKDLSRIVEQEKDLKGRQEQWDGFKSDVKALAEQTGRPLIEGASPIEMLEQWSLEERQASQAYAEKTLLEDRLTECGAQLEMERNRMQHERHTMEELMKTAGADGEESFRELSRRHQEFRDLQQQAAALITGIVCGMEFEDETSMRRTMGPQDWKANAQEEADLKSQLRDMRARAEDLSTALGRLSREMEALETEDETEKLLAIRQDLEGRINESVRQWLVLKLSSAALGRTLAMYESERQPKLLQRSSEIFRSLTGDAFRSIIFPLDRDVLKVERSDGTRVQESFLSRGTAEQLYLSLRLAHLEEYSRKGWHGPVLMDDILVNFDRKRARHTATALVDFAEANSIQVLFFTCHPEMAELFPESVVRRELTVEEKVTPWKHVLYDKPEKSRIPAASFADSP